MPDTMWEEKLDVLSLNSDNDPSLKHYIRMKETFDKLIETQIDYEEVTKKLQQFIKNLYYEWVVFV